MAKKQKNSAAKKALSFGKRQRHLFVIGILILLGAVYFIFNQVGADTASGNAKALEGCKKNMETGCRAYFDAKNDRDGKSFVQNAKNDNEMSLWASIINNGKETAELALATTNVTDCWSLQRQCRQYKTDYNNVVAYNKKSGATTKNSKVNVADVKAPPPAKTEAPKDDQKNSEPKSQSYTLVVDNADLKVKYSAGSFSKRCNIVVRALGNNNKKLQTKTARCSSNNHAIGTYPAIVMRKLDPKTTKNIYFWASDGGLGLGQRKNTFTIDFNKLISLGGSYQRIAEAGNWTTYGEGNNQGKIERRYLECKRNNTTIDCTYAPALN